MVQHVTAHHLTRLACLYVRQSTLQQVLENTESTARQYALRERARALGWADERIVVIDQDLGHSGASTVDRLGFQRLVAEVGLGQVELVLGLEVSRLARNSSDWHHLLESCSHTSRRGDKRGQTLSKDFSWTGRPITEKFPHREQDAHWLSSTGKI